MCFAIHRRFFDNLLGVYAMVTNLYSEKKTSHYEKLKYMLQIIIVH